MKGISKGYDPELGKKFSAESNGLVIGRARSSPRKSEEQARLEYIAEHGRAPDAQQLHDAMLPMPGAPPRGTRESPGHHGEDDAATASGSVRRPDVAKKGDR